MKAIIRLTQGDQRLRQRRRGRRTYGRVPEPEFVPWLLDAYVMTRGQRACMVHASVPSTHGEVQSSSSPQVQRARVFIQTTRLFFDCLGIR